MRAIDSIFTAALPVGIDVGASGVRLLQLRRKGRGLAVQAAARLDVPFSGKLDAPERALQIAEATARRIGGGGFAGRDCVISVDNRLVRVRSVRQPPMPDDELDRAIRLDAPSRLGFGEADPAEVAWLRAGPVRVSGDPRDEVLVIGCATAGIERLVFALASEGLRPVAVEPSFIACARAHTRKLRRASDENVVRAIVDIGHATTGVTVTKGQRIVFYKQLELGGDAMTRAAALRLGLDPSAVAELRRQRAVAAASGASQGDAKVDRALFEAVRPVMGDLANEAGLCLRYYGVTFRGLRPECCLIAGGEASEPRLAETFGESLHVPTMVARPLEGIHSGGAAGVSPGWETSDAAWSAAVGLSMRSWLARPTLSERRADAQNAAAEMAAASAERRAAA
jgi:type IV pilus assembly protein PilM